MLPLPASGMADLRTGAAMYDRLDDQSLSSYLPYDRLPSIPRQVQAAG